MRLICVAVAGLCNRIQTLLCARTLADKTGRKLAVFWRNDGACGCNWPDLFFPSIELVDREPAVEYALTCPAAERPKIEQCLREAAGSVSRQDVVFSAYYLGDAARHFQHFAELFRPIQQIQSRVRELSDRLSHPSVGVHVRRGDYLRNPQGPAVASLDDYLRAVDKVLKRTLAKKIFLATDDGAPERHSCGPGGKQPQRVYEAFAAAFGATTIVRQPSPDLNRSSPSAIQDALVDLLSLRQCDVICGQSGSSFTRIASIGKENIVLGGSPHHGERPA